MPRQQMIRLVDGSDVILVPPNLPAKSVHSKAWQDRKEVLYTSGPMQAGFLLPYDFAEVSCDPNDEGAKRVMQFVPEAT